MKVRNKVSQSLIGSEMILVVTNSGDYSSTFYTVNILLLYYYKHIYIKGWSNDVFGEISLVQYLGIQ